MRTKLIIIDPQNSFCKAVEPADQQVQHDGELCVPGAWEDMLRLSTMVDRLGKRLDDIAITMDSHHRLHVAHPTFWRRQSDGAQPDPFTIMKAENGTIQGYNALTNEPTGEFTTIIPSFFQWRDKTTGEMFGAYPYLTKLAASNRYPCCIWPKHCLIGTPGHNVVVPLAEALFKWEEAQGAAYVEKITKGSNIFVEHYSAVRAEVTDPNDPSTNLNSDFIQDLMEYDEILLSGEARSHCLANTVRDIADEFSEDDKFIKKCVLLEDCTSDVPGFEALGESFVKDMVARGMKVTTSVDYLA